MKEQARVMKRLSIAPDVILTSPLVRARETAEIVAEALHGTEKLEIEKTLGIPCDRKALVARLAQLPVDCTVMLVGHDPDMSQMPGYFIGIPTLRLPFKKGTLCRVDVSALPPRAHGEIRLFIHPKQLRALHK